MCMRLCACVCVWEECLFSLLFLALWVSRALAMLMARLFPFLDKWVGGTYLALGEMQTSGLKESCRYTSEGKTEVHKILP